MLSVGVLNTLKKPTSFLTLIAFIFNLFAGLEPALCKTAHPFLLSLEDKGPSSPKPPQNLQDFNQKVADRLRKPQGNLLKPGQDKLPFDQKIKAARENLREAAENDRIQNLLSRVPVANQNVASKPAPAPVPYPYAQRVVPKIGPPKEFTPPANQNARKVRLANKNKQIKTTSKPALKVIKGTEAKPTPQKPASTFNQQVAEKLKQGARKADVPAPKTSTTTTPSAPKAVKQEVGKTLKAGEKSLLPGEGKVGTYGDLDAKSIKGDNLASHHIPNDKYMQTKGISREEGIAVRVEEPRPGTGGRHREIHKQLKEQDPNLSPREALAQGVKRTRKIYQKDGLGKEIRPSLQEVIKKNKEKYPHLFKKDGH